MTDIATNLSTIDGSLSDIKTAIVAKGVTPSGNITTYATAIGNISSGGGGGDVTLTRFKDDTNTEIGTHFCNFTDANNNTYKVIVLDAVYRSNSVNWCSNYGSVTNMPMYDSVLKWWYNSQETATQNTQLILDYCTANSYTSTACEHCRSKSFTINGTTYYGQLPSMREIFEMWKYRAEIETMDITATSYTSLNFSSSRSLWSSSQVDMNYGWMLYQTGNINTAGKQFDYFACPVLEIPNS